MAFLILAFIFLVIAVIVFNTVGFWEFFKHCTKAGLVAGLMSFVIIVPVGICYVFIAFIHAIVGGLKHES